jgi:hypothetical protein
MSFGYGIGDFIATLTLAYQIRERFANAPADTYVEPGDKVCVLAGGANPFVLRGRDGVYQVVNYCFVYGMMHGAMMDMHRKGHIPLEKIIII